MRTMKTCLMVGLIMLIGSVVQAEDKVTYVTALSSTTMPSIDTKDRPLESVLDQIKAKVPDFHFVIHREAGVPANYPVLSAMTLTQVTVDQFLTLMGDQFPDVHIKYIPDVEWKVPPLIEINIASDTTTQPATTQPTVVRVFGLGQVIAYRASIIEGEGDHNKQATNDILSLIQAALGEVDTMVKPQMKVHAATQTLICKVTEDQGKVIEQVLQALKPTEAQARQMEDQQRVRTLQIEGLESALKTTLNDSGPKNPRVMAMEKEITRLKGESAATESAQPATQP